MNVKDKQDLELVHYRLDEIDKKIDEIKIWNEQSHIKSDERLKFIKDNLFNPNEGLWAETKLNTQFRIDTSKWRGIVGVGVVALMLDKVWSMLQSQ
jgi:hypothetical protein